MTDLSTAQELDSKYLSMRCAVHHSPPCRYINPTVRFIANIFNISPRDHNGNVRVLGFTSCPPSSSQAVFWILELIGCDMRYVVCSNYEVTLIETEPRHYTYIIHPVPVDDLHKCELFPRPRWHIDDYGPVELTEVNKRSAWKLPIEGVVYISGWAP